MSGLPQRDKAPAGAELPALSPDLAPSVASSKSEDAASEGQLAGGEKRGASQGFEEAELEAALQLLVERAQYITGATGAALALPQGGEMVCRASAGACAPSVGARLQVRSGLTGESIARRQLLRCDNAETDPRVNLETCRALGIASIVVLPMLRRNGEVRGLFELFSDHPYAFEERDLIALERMADLTLTALDLAEQRHGGIPPARAIKTPGAGQEKPAAPVTLGPILQSVVQATDVATAGATQAPASPAGSAETESPALEPPQIKPFPTKVQASTVSAANQTKEAETQSLASVPEAMRRVQKCASCGFPISEGRTICLDCEKKKSELGESGPSGIQKVDEPAEAVAEDEDVPAFLADAENFKESWLSNHLNHLLAILVLILGVLVAIVVFR